MSPTGTSGSPSVVQHHPRVLQCHPRVLQCHTGGSSVTGVGSGVMQGDSVSSRGFQHQPGSSASPTSAPVSPGGWSSVCPTAVPVSPRGLHHHPWVLQTDSGRSTVTRWGTSFTDGWPTVSPGGDGGGRVQPHPRVPQSLLARSGSRPAYGGGACPSGGGGACPGGGRLKGAEPRAVGVHAHPPPASVPAFLCFSPPLPALGSRGGEVTAARRRPGSGGWWRARSRWPSC